MPVSFARIAFLAYLALSLLLYGHGAIGHPDSVCACSGDGDPTSFMWTFEWWPHALGHGLNPFFPHVIWSPEGANLTQGGFAIPAAAIVLAPVTLVAGPFVAYNVASVLMPVLAAWFAYRLCRYLTGAAGPAFVGGLVFGFGTYMSAHLLGHLNLTSVFLVPAAVLLVLQRLDERISQRRFVVLMAVVFAVQLGLSAEVLLLGLGVGALALLLGYAVSDPVRRRRIVGVLPVTLAAGGLAMIVASPYLYWILDGLGDADSDAWKTFTELYPGDALNPIVPTEVTGLGHWWFEDMSSKFTNFTPSEAAAYVGPVLLAIVIAFAVTHWRRPATRVLLGVIVVCYVLSLGTRLHVGGDDTGVWMPWSLLHPLPVFDHVISTRFWAFALLAIAIVVALWLAEPSRRAGVKWAVGAPRRRAAGAELHVEFLGRPHDRPGLLQDGRLQRAPARGGDRARPPLRALREQHALAGTHRHVLQHGRGLRVARVPARLPQRPVLRPAGQRASRRGGRAGAARLPQPPPRDRRGGGGEARRTVAAAAWRAGAEARQDGRRAVLPRGRLGSYS